MIERPVAVFFRQISGRFLPADIGPFLPSLFGHFHPTLTNATDLNDKTPEVTENKKDNTYIIEYKDLPTVSYDGTTFTYYVYKVREDINKIPEYTADKTEAANGETITNTHPVAFDRKLSGTTWFDADGNGIYDQNEYPMKGVTVSLYKKNGNKYEPYMVNGNNVSTATKDDGTYEFTGLPAGDYQVIFSDGSKEISKISNFDLTSKRIGNDAAKRSVAEKDKNGTVSVTEQNDVKGDIELKTDEKLAEDNTKSQVIPDLNAGFVPKKTNISVTKKWKDESNKDKLRPNAEEFAKYLHLYRHNADEAVEVTGVNPEIKDNGDNTYTIQYSKLDSVSYDGNSFTHYSYTVKENEVPNYTTESAEVGNGDVITNKHEVKYNRGFSGKVWFDEDHNGELESRKGDYVLSGITVKLQKLGPDNTYVDVSKDGQAVTATTDQNGEYEFTDLEPGTYQVVIVNPQFVTKKSDSSDGTKSIASNDQFDETGKPVSAVIATITMPTDDVIRGMKGKAPKGSELSDDGKTYTLLHQDAGFIDFTPVKTETAPGKNKKPTTDNGDTVKPDDQITYTVSYMNTHSEKADVTVTDTLDSNVSFVSADQNGSYDESRRTVKWTLKDVDPYAQGTVQLIVKVENGAVEAKQVQNTATVQVGNDAGQNTNTVTNPTEPKPTPTPSEPTTPTEPDKPTPSEPSVTPAPTPTITPEPTPSQTPDVTPVPSDTPVPSTTPETVVPGGKPSSTPSVSPSPKTKSEVKKNEAPDTSDHSQNGLYAGLLGLCVVFIVWRVLGIRKEHHNE